jgi:hypothetical protein
VSLLAEAFLPLEAFLAGFTFQLRNGLALRVRGSQQKRQMRQKKLRT